MTDITLKNEGQEDMTSATVYWQLNGGVVNQEDWTGSLASGESTMISIELSGFLEGTNTLLAYSSNPSGMMDQDVTNDTLSRNFEATNDGQMVTLEIVTDIYPNETTWELLDLNGTVLQTGGPYSQGQATFTHEWCLPNACYTFIIYDSYGDGIFDSGGYTISDANGVELAGIIEQNFGFQESNDFCAEFICMLSSELTPTPESETGANDGVIIVTTNNGSAPFEYSLDSNTPQSTPIFSGLEAGTYTVVVTDANGCTFEEDVDVPLCNLTFSGTTVQESATGAADGSIEINVGSGNAPYLYSIDNGTNFQAAPLFENLGAGIYMVVVQDVLGCERTLEVEISVMTDVVEVNGTSVKVYPNPSEDGYVVIDVHGLQNADFVYYDVMDVSGKVVQRARLAPVNNYHTGRFTIANYADGVYFVRFKNDQLDQAVRVVKKSN